LNSADTPDSASLVLIVDDDAATRALHCGILRPHFRILNAASGAEALRLAARHQPDLILLDVGMPELDGFETCRRLREQSAVPIIFATMHDSTDEQLKACEAGGTDLFVKPVSAQLLIRKLHLCIAQHRERERNRLEAPPRSPVLLQLLTACAQTPNLVQFIRSCLACDSYAALAQHLVSAAAMLGADCSVLIEHDNSETHWGAQGPLSALELSVIHQLKAGLPAELEAHLFIRQGHVSMLVPQHTRGEQRGVRHQLKELQVMTDLVAELCSQVALRHAQQKATQAG
jgi:DNA-binding response OmpR family regulator